MHVQTVVVYCKRFIPSGKANSKANFRIRPARTGRNKKNQPWAIVMAFSCGLIRSLSGYNNTPNVWEFPKIRGPVINHGYGPCCRDTQHTNPQCVETAISPHPKDGRSQDAPDFPGSYNQAITVVINLLYTFFVELKRGYWVISTAMVWLQLPCV